MKNVYEDLFAAMKSYFDTLYGFDHRVGHFRPLTIRG